MRDHECIHHFTRVPTRPMNVTPTTVDSILFSSLGRSHPPHDQEKSPNEYSHVRLFLSRDSDSPKARRMGIYVNAFAFISSKWRTITVATSHHPFFPSLLLHPSLPRLIPSKSPYLLLPQPCAQSSSPKGTRHPRIHPRPPTED